jgi:hypothetical protein
MITACTYPVANKLALAARPTLCGAKGHLMITDVPYDENRTGMGTERIIYKAQMLCMKHSIEIATYKFAQELPKQPFTDGEIEFLLDHGFEMIDLVDPDDPRSPQYIAPPEELNDNATNPQITEH